MNIENTRDGLERVVQHALRSVQPSLSVREVGKVETVSNSVAVLSGLPDVRAQELVQFSDGTLALTLDLEPDRLGVALLGSSSGIQAGSEVRRTHRVADTVVGPQLLGRCIDATGRALDTLGVLTIQERRPIERECPPILDRAPVSTPLETGLKVVDALIPIGQGQRQLVVGDRRTGKTALAIDAIINQRDKDMICVYCAVGQRGSAVSRVVEVLREHNALAYTVCVIAGGDAPPGLKFITPYAATTIAEYFLDQGRDVLVVYDDLTQHALAYRELSLLLRRPPGREAYPGDIFYLHSRLLERAAKLNESRGNGSLTALPIIQTEAQNIAAYIPTNLISITDGQIYLSPDLFQKGIFPAVDVNRSVSRVGGRAQLPAFQSLSGALRLAYAQFEELETFSRFGTRLDSVTRNAIERGRRVRETLQQAEHSPLSSAEQVAILLALDAGLFDDLPVAAIRSTERTLLSALSAQLQPFCDKVQRAEPLGSEDRQLLLNCFRSTLSKASAGPT